MENSMHDDVMRVLEELDGAFSGYSNHHRMNGDYAEFASMAINQFRRALRDPSMTREDLKVLLRQTIKTHQSDDPGMSWSQFAAVHMSRAANESELA